MTGSLGRVPSVSSTTLRFLASFEKCVGIVYIVVVVLVLVLVLVVVELLVLVVDVDVLVLVDVVVLVLVLLNLVPSQLFPLHLNHAF